MAVSDKIQRTMPMMQDRDKGKPLAYKEAVLLTNPVDPKMKGEVISISLSTIFFQSM